jgi:hypothetical protein
MVAQVPVGRVRTIAAIIAGLALLGLLIIAARNAKSPQMRAHRR